MRTGVAFTVGPDDQRRLQAIVENRNAKQKHVWRARIILESAHGHGTMEIMRRTGKSKNCVWRWQKRYMLEGVDGLLHDATRPPGRAKVADAKVREVIELTNSPHLAASRAGAAPLALLQALDRPGVRRQAARRCGTLCQPARTCRGCVGGREVSDSGVGPHAETASHEERQATEAHA